MNAQSVVISQERLHTAYTTALAYHNGDAKAALSMVAAAVEIATQRRPAVTFPTMPETEVTDERG